MNIAITFRHLEVSEPIKAHAEEKVSRLQKFLRQPMRAKVTLSIENKLHACEIEIGAGSAHFVAHDTNEDMYACIDRVLEKLERQVNAAHGSNIARKRGADSAGAFASAQVNDATHEPH